MAENGKRTPLTWARDFLVTVSLVSGVTAGLWIFKAEHDQNTRWFADDAAWNAEQLAQMATIVDQQRRILDEMKAIKREVNWTELGMRDLEHQYRATERNLWAQIYEFRDQLRDFKRICRP